MWIADEWAQNVGPEREYYEPNPPEDRERRIVAGSVNSLTGQVEPVTDIAGFWRLLAPSEPLPPAEEIEKAWLERQTAARRRSVYTSPARR